MISFKHFNESSEKVLSMISAAGDMPFDEWLNQAIVGKSFKQVMDMGTYINLYFGNKYGMGPQHNSPDQAIQHFTDKLTTVLNPLLKPDRSGKRPRPEETPEFAERYNKDEYNEYEKLNRDAMRNMIKARQAGDDEEFRKWMGEREKYTHLRSNTEFQTERSRLAKETEQIVKDMFATPISVEDISSISREYPKEFGELQAAYDGMLSHTSDSRSG